MGSSQSLQRHLNTHALNVVRTVEMDSAKGSRRGGPSMMADVPRTGSVHIAVPIVGTVFAGDSRISGYLKTINAGSGALSAVGSVAVISIASGFSATGRGGMGSAILIVLIAVESAIVTTIAIG